MEVRRFLIWSKISTIILHDIFLANKLWTRLNDSLPAVTNLIYIYPIKTNSTKLILLHFLAPHHHPLLLLLHAISPLTNGSNSGYSYLHMTMHAYNYFLTWSPLFLFWNWLLKLYIDDIIDYSETIFIFLFHTRSKARGILLVITN